MAWSFGRLSCSFTTISRASESTLKRAPSISSQSLSGSKSSKVVFASIANASSGPAVHAENDEPY